MNLLTYQLEAGRLYATLPTYQRELQFALDGVEAMMKLAPRSYVSLSFGKQSLPLARMVYDLAPATPMYFLASSESWWLHNYEEVIDTFLRRFPVDLTIVQTNRLGLDLSEPILSLSQKQPGIKWVFKGWAADDSTDWQTSRDAGQNDLQEMCGRSDWDGWYWGLSKDESYGRRMTLSYRWPGQPHPSIFCYRDGKYRCCPFQNWGINDLAAYIAVHNLKLLAAYDDGLEARTTARVTRKMADYGGLPRLRWDNPRGFAALVQRFPELQHLS